MDNKETNPSKYSQEDLQKMRDVNTAFYKDQLEHLEIQDKYLDLKAKIAENRYKEMLYKVKYAELVSPKETQSKNDSQKP